MRERLQSYLDYMEEVTPKDLEEEEKEQIIKDFMIQIDFFQHERLIHLIVTVTFAIIAIFTTLINFRLENLIVLFFLLIMFVMLFFYIRHYFFLERGVQKLYTYYDILIKK